MAVSHKGAISFGLVHIPIALHTATQDNDIRFNQLCRQDHSRVRYKKVCAGCGKEIGPGDIVKGFEYEEDRYVIVTDEDFEKIKTEKDRSIQILHFAELASIPPIYYDRTYHAVPEAGGEKAFELLRRAMREEGRVAVGKTVMQNRETLLAIVPTDQGLLVETMFFAEEIREVPKQAGHPDVSDPELTMAKTLIASMDRPFEPEQYKDEYQQRLRALIASKIAGREVVAPKDEPADNVISLMDALKASLEQVKPDKPPKPARTRKKQGA